MKAPTRDELLAAITEACKPQLPPSDPGFTTEELREAFSRDEGRSVSLGATRRRIKDALARGVLVEGRRWRVDRAKRTVSETVYRAA